MLFKKHKGIGEILYVKQLSSGDFNYQTGLVDGVINEKMIELGYTPIAILATTYEECNETSGNDRYMSLTGIDSKKLLANYDGGSDITQTTDSFPFGFSLKNFSNSTSAATYHCSSIGVHKDSNNITFSGITVPTVISSDTTSPFYGEKRFSIKRSGDTKNRYDADGYANRETILDNFNGYDSSYQLYKDFSKNTLNENFYHTTDKNLIKILNENLSGTVYNYGIGYSATSSGDSTINMCIAVKGCHDYKTLGTNEGDWYLPSVGELYNVMVSNHYALDIVINDIDKTVIMLYDYTDGVSRSICDYTGITSSGKVIEPYRNFAYFTDETESDKHKFLHSVHLKSKVNKDIFNGIEFYYCDTDKHICEINLFGKYNHATSTISNKDRSGREANDMVWVVGLKHGIGAVDCGANLDYRNSPNDVRAFLLGNYRDAKYRSVIEGFN